MIWFQGSSRIFQVCIECVSIHCVKKELCDYVSPIVKEWEIWLRLSRRGSSIHLNYYCRIFILPFYGTRSLNRVVVRVRRPELSIDTNTYFMYKSIFSTFNELYLGSPFLSSLRSALYLNKSKQKFWWTV